MKTLKILFSTLLLVGFITLGNSQEDASGPIMSFETLTVDYGEIVQHSDPLRVAKFTNTGDEPLVISNARGSCGCTVPQWPKELSLIHI